MNISQYFSYFTYTCTKKIFFSSKTQIFLYRSFDRRSHPSYMHKTSVLYGSTRRPPYIISCWMLYMNQFTAKVMVKMFTNVF